MRPPLYIRQLKAAVATAALMALQPVVTYAVEPVAADARIEQAARAALLEQLRAAGLKDALIQLTVLTGNHQQSISPCSGKLEVETLDTRSSARMRFAAVCTYPAWRVERVVRASVSAMVVTATGAINAQQPIGADDVVVQRHDVSLTPDAVSDPAEVIGKASQRALHGGDVVSRRWLVEPVLVQRGSIVTIVAHQDGLTAQVAGEVMEQGRRNDVVHVRNTASGKIILARVLSQQTVEPTGLPGQ